MLLDQFASHLGVAADHDLAAVLWEALQPRNASFACRGARDVDFSVQALDRAMSSRENSLTASITGATAPL